MRRILTAVVLCIGAFALAACGGNDNGSTTTAPSTAPVSATVESTPTTVAVAPSSASTTAKNDDVDVVARCTDIQSTITVTSVQTPTPSVESRLPI